uniref:SLA-DQ beta1 domain n=1 Tax=Sus scrofa TaxID=9823 RepID=A0ABB5UQ82_PIG
MSGMVALRLPRGLWTAALTVMLVVLGAPVAEGRDSPQDFVYQFKFECYFFNGTQRVRGVARWVYNQEEHVRFDSDVGEFRAVTPLGRPTADYWNGQKDVLEQKRAEVDTVCKHNYQIEEGTTLQRRVQPTVTISPSKAEALNHHNLLVCAVTDFYPSQVLVMLEMNLQRGDVYTCRVEHSSLQNPILVEWRAQSESAQSKMLSGVGGFVLGLIFLGLGLFIRHRSQKGLVR